jgi:orotate phosphoribosyltransferase-like protein
VEKPRKLADVAKQVRKMREDGKTVPEIAIELKVSYVVVNQLVLRSYKMVARTEEVFQRQEEMRLGLI